MTRKGEQRLICAALIFLLLSAVVMGVVSVVWRADLEAEAQKTMPTLSGNGKESFYKTEEGLEADLVIPLPRGTEAQDITYMEKTQSKEFVLRLQDVSKEFFTDQPVLVGTGAVAGVACVYEGSAVVVTFLLCDYYEARLQTKSDRICVELRDPLETYDKAFVMEGVGGVWQKSAADALQEHGIKGFLYGDVEAANEMRADGFLSLAVENTAGTEGDRAFGGCQMTIFYNDGYYIPGFDSGAFAGALQQYLKEQYGWEILVEESEEELLQNATVPAVRIDCRISGGAVSEEALGRAFADALAQIP